MIYTHDDNIHNLKKLYLITFHLIFIMLQLKMNKIFNNFDQS